MSSRPSDADTKPLDLSRSIRDFEGNRTVYHATDLIGHALALNQFETARVAADFILSEPGKAPQAASAMAKRVLSGSDAVAVSHVNERADSHALVAWLRASLSDQPRDAIMWVDLALVHTIQGNTRSAERAIRTALGLARNNRFVLRAATRFFIHQKDYATAHGVLTGADKTRFDPWLLAAEMVAASIRGIPSRYIKLSRSVVDDDSIAPIHRSELAASLATIELEAGEGKRAKKLFKTALVDPTENTLAQLEFSSKRLPGLASMVANLDATPRTFEARAWEGFLAGNWSEAQKSADDWLVDQPFSSRPAQFSSFTAAAMLEDYRHAIWIVEGARKANRDDPTLINNLAFAYASSGNVDKAAEILDRLSVDELHGSIKIAALATQGLVRFRKHDIEQGRILYRQAIELAVRQDRGVDSASARLYLAREEALAQTTIAAEAFASAQENATRLGNLAVNQISKHVEKTIQAHRMDSTFLTS